LAGPAFLYSDTGLAGAVDRPAWEYFLLPFLFIGAWLEPEERYQLALWLAAFT